MDILPGETLFTENPWRESQLSTVARSASETPKRLPNSSGVSHW